MSYIDAIFSRANIQQIREFLLHGVEGSIDPRSYKERMEQARKTADGWLSKKCRDEAEYMEIMGYVYDYVTVAEQVSMEIGMQVGAILTAQVCQNLKSAFLEE